MKMVEGILRQWQHHTCNHHWIRARWEDGSYGLRCARCMAAYPRTWNDVIGTRTGAMARREAAARAAVAELHDAA